MLLSASNRIPDVPKDNSFTMAVRVLSVSCQPLDIVGVRLAQQPNQCGSGDCSIAHPKLAYRVPHNYLDSGFEFQPKNVVEKFSYACRTYVRRAVEFIYSTYAEAGGGAS